jgi:hypothetical protein
VPRLVLSPHGKSLFRPSRSEIDQWPGWRHGSGQQVHEEVVRDQERPPGDPREAGRCPAAADPAPSDRQVGTCPALPLSGRRLAETAILVHDGLQSVKGGWVRSRRVAIHGEADLPSR